MKKIIRKIISTICVRAMLVVSTVNMVFAAQHSASGNISTVVSIKVYEKVIDAELTQKMKALGMTQDEINYLLKSERARIFKLNASTLSNLIGIVSLPSNPKIGDYHTEKHHVYFTSAAMTVTGVVAALVGAGVGLAVALAISAGALDDWLQGQDAKGVDVTIKYYYGPDNQGSVGWTPGPVTWELLYQLLRMGDFMEQIGREKWYQLTTFVILWLLATALIYFILNLYGVFFPNSRGLVINITLFALVLVYMYHLRRKYGSNGTLWKDKKFLRLFSIVIILAAGMAISTRLF